MDLGWEEQQRAFQARVITQSTDGLGLRPYRTFVGSARPAATSRVGRIERLVVCVVMGTAVVAALLAFGAAREMAALVASFTGGVALMISVAPESSPSRPGGWTPLLAIYQQSVMRGARPICVTEISLAELDRLGIEGFATVVGVPRPGSSFGLFVDDHLVWPRTPPRGPEPDDPRFGSA